MTCYRIALLSIVLTGCASVGPISPTVYDSPKESIEHKVDTTYKLGEATQAFVGERMLRIQDHFIRVSQSGSNSIWLSPTEDFELKLPPLMHITVRTTDTAIVQGRTEKNGVSYRVISLPGAGAGLRFLIDDDGAFEGSAVNTMGAKMGWSYTPTPSSVRFIPRPSSTRIDETKGFTNFELVYGGTSGPSFQVLYREYTQNDLARPAFTQTLVYEKEAKNIRFRNLQINVQEASNDKIIFTVVADENR